MSNKKEANLEPKIKDKIIGVITLLFPDAKIYLYGSRAKGTNRDRSDIDVAIDTGKKVRVGEAKSMLEASYIPYKIDLIDLNSVSQDMRDVVLKEGILWKK